MCSAYVYMIIRVTNGDTHLMEGKARWRWDVQTPTVRMTSPAKKSQFHTGLHTRNKGGEGGNKGVLG